ncbi:flagellar filament capping protein FliD [Herbaspirillum huttiense]|uniref:flagellar filament capping protein FliD n=1 Tax=Herbaspirillum TaxID=963 RepID=UPI0004057815|nr:MULTISPECIES: flagellar filament capping protein FliD [Herbaspirillum]MAF03083.1 flagellar hook protein [Herbaspirillum sp.]MBN9358546.1 flagellar filament capping protein FliD [Herbaspirillum huttiense]MBO14638.1 flagellar hook protein [Herbaspirillum sp.]MCP3655083.1 flagellar filament capping protein FliD [Herbaspirillum sp.]MCP3945738.1 flagellar filament capping protein FliD [Herbaspirillum sp.]
MATSTGTISTSAGPLDVSTLVSQLISAESQTQLTPLTTQASSYNTLISAYGSLKSALSSYQSAIKSLTSASFSSQKSSVSNAGTGTTLTTDPFTADVNSDDSTKILAQKLQSAGVSSGTTYNAGDSIAIKIGTNSPTFITLQANSTLAGVRDAINASKAGVTASITTDASGDHLVLESATGGTANTIKVTANNSLSAFAYDPSSSTPSTMTQIQAPRDATKAASGTYSVAVSQLAQTAKLSSASITPGTTFDNGILAIKTGTGSTAIIQPATNTLAGVRDAINSSDAGVNATIVSDGTNDHLVITAKDSGAANTIKITGTGNYSVFSADPSGTVISPNVSTSQTYSSGTLSLKVGDTTVAINPTANGSGNIDLNQVMSAINSASAGVTASISNDGTNNHLVLTPTGSSATAAVSLTGSGDYSGLTMSGMGQLLKAQDAKLSIDGVAVTSTSNKVENAISGVTLNLAKVTTSSDNFTLNISNDTSGITTAANSFVTAYNTLAKAVAGMTAQTPSTTLGQANNSAPLASESSVQTIMNQLRNTLFATVDGGNGISSLSDIGISFQKDGTLALDSTKLATAATNNFAGIANLFTGTDPDTTNTTSSKNGIVTKLQTLMTSLLSDSGIIASKTNGLQASLKINQDRQTTVQTRLSNLKDDYTNQFNRLNVTLASMQSTQSYLTQQLASLAKSS